MSGEASAARTPVTGDTALRLLLVEDSRFDARLIQTFLAMADAPRPVEVVHVTRLADACQRLTDETFDCVLLDLGLPDGEGLGNIDAVTRVSGTTAIIVLTGLKNDTIATTALQQGAQDYIVKGDYEDGDALLRTIRYAVERRAKEVKESAAARQASEDLVRGIVATVPDALVTVRDGGRIESANPAAERMFGYPAAELIGQTVYDLNPPERREQSVAFIDGLLTGKLAVDDLGEHEGVGLRADGSRFPTEVSIGRMTDDYGPVLVCAVRDISERKRAEENLETAREQLMVSEKLASLGGLVAGVAHEINTPVGIGVTAASHLQEQTDALMESVQAGQLKRSALEAYLQTAREATNILLGNLRRAAELIQGFKQVAVDQSSDESRSFQVKPYLDDVLLSLAPNLKKTQHQVDFRCPDDLWITGHPGNWSQIVTNLVMNALTHAFDEGQAGVLQLHITQQDDRIAMRFSDDGRGIPADHLKLVFDPFFTTKRGQGGSGLGLHIVYNLATQAMGGSVRCESREGEGTVFEFSFPFTQGQPGATHG